MGQANLASCHCCGLVQRLPELAPDHKAVCCRCATPLTHGNASRNRLAAALAAAALAFYLPATMLPMLRIE